MQTNALGVAQECSGLRTRAAGTPLRILNWNVEGLIGKVCEANFTHYVSDFPVVSHTHTHKMFLERSDPLDCFRDFLQFFSPAVKLSQRGRSIGGVLVLVKHAYGKNASVLDLSQDNMVWIKQSVCVCVCV